MKRDPSGSPPIGRLHVAAWLFGLLALAAVVAFGAHLGEFEHFLALLRSLAPAWLLLALLLQAATYLSVAASWQLGLRRAGVVRPFRKLLPLALGKLFMDQTLPSGGISGIGYLVAALVRRGVPAPACMSVLLANMVGYFASCLLSALAAIGLLRIESAVQPWMVGVTVLYGLLTVAIPFAVLAARRLGRRELGWLDRIPGSSALLEPLADAPVTLLRSPRVVLAMIGLNVAVIAFDAGTLWVMLHSLGLATPFEVVFPSFVLAMMVATLGPIPMGLGTFEATCVAALVLQGVPIEAALTATLLLRGCTTWLPMFPGLVQVRRELRAQR